MFSLLIWRPSLTRGSPNIVRLAFPPLIVLACFPTSTFIRIIPAMKTIQPSVWTADDFDIVFPRQISPLFNPIPRVFPRVAVFTSQFFARFAIIRRIIPERPEFYLFGTPPGGARFLLFFETNLAVLWRMIPLNVNAN